MSRGRSDLGWMEMQVVTLFVHDGQGRLVSTNEAETREAPRFFFGRTRHGNLWRFRAGSSAALVRALSRLAGREGLPDRVSGPAPERWGAIRACLEEESAIREEGSGPAYRFPATLRPPEVRGARLGDPAKPSTDVGLRDLARDAASGLPTVAVELDGETVCACWSARGAAGKALEAGVHTVASARGRGLAAFAVAHWARLVMQQGGTPLYSTSFSNRSSRAVARRLGLVRYGEDWHLT